MTLFLLFAPLLTMNHYAVLSAKIPEKYSLDVTNTKEVIDILSGIYTGICHKNDEYCTENKRCINMFASLMPNRITIDDYLHRIMKFTLCSGRCFIISLIYIDRMIHQQEQQKKDMYLYSGTSHRLILTSIVLATKYHHDQNESYEHRYYARVGGISATELSYLEYEFLRLMDFDLYVSAQEFDSYVRKLEEYYSSSLTGDFGYYPSANKGAQGCKISNHQKIERKIS